MPIVPAVGTPTPQPAVAAALAELRAGRPVVIPTDTVYGLAADPFSAAATAAVFTVKRRPAGVPLAVLVSGTAAALDLVEGPTDAAAVLMDRFWPGGLTIVLRQRPGLPFAIASDDATVGLRCADHAVPAALTAAFGPIAATSANRHGHDTPATAAAVSEALGGEVGVVLDAGPCDGEPSTVVDCTGAEPRVLREGAVATSDLLAALR